jgi:hypothetical protein
MKQARGSLASEEADARRRRRRRGLRLVVIGACIVVPVLLWSCFPAPVKELWPPRPGELRHRIDVICWDWHTFILQPHAGPLPEADLLDAGIPPDEGYLEWGFVEKAWYLEARQGILGVLRALLLPTASGVARERTAIPYWERHPERARFHWKFVLSEQGFRKLVEYLEAQRGEPLPGFLEWYEGRYAYHLFHNCHHFTASALRAAGLPIRPWWAFAGWMMTIQLNRIERFHEREGLVPDGPPPAERLPAEAPR